MGIVFGEGGQFSSGKPGRRKRVATPDFGHTPYNPITGNYANLQTQGMYPYCAMMQVAETDSYDDYVICRGFDTRIQKFVDYAAGDSDKPGIMVAKPYGCRTSGRYIVGGVFPAFLPTQGVVTETFTHFPPSPSDVDWRVGQNPGVADAGTLGQPTNLSTAISELTDHNSKNIQWMLIDTGSGAITATRVRGQQVGALLSSDATNGVDNLIGLNGIAPTGTITAYNTHDWDADDGAATRCEWNQEDEQWEMYQVNCTA